VPGIDAGHEQLTDGGGGGSGWGVGLVEHEFDGSEML
jgi:hypothetical protein